MPRFGVILAAAGQSSRFGSAAYKKPFAPLAGRPVWLHSAEKFLDRDDVKQLVVVVAPEDREAFVDTFGANLAFMGITLAEGGAQRADSVRNGLEKLRPEIDMVAIHDAPRPGLDRPRVRGGRARRCRDLGNPRRLHVEAGRSRRHDP
jgi:2-C-methyl-D-erythritol 4-phosphate cytidylyltransferase